jgi:hypothetical protein
LPDTDRHFALRIVEAVDDVDPARKIGIGRGQAKVMQHFVVQPFGMILQRHRIDAARVERRDHRRFAHIAELRDLGPLAFGQRLFATAEQDVGLNAEPVSSRTECCVGLVFSSPAAAM